MGDLDVSVKFRSGEGASNARHGLGRLGIWRIRDVCTCQGIIPSTCQGCARSRYGKLIMEEGAAETPCHTLTCCSASVDPASIDQQTCDFDVRSPSVGNRKQRGQRSVNSISACLRQACAWTSSVSLAELAILPWQ